MKKYNKIQQFLIDRIASHPHDIIKLTCQQFAITRTTALRQMSYLIKKGLVIKTGQTKQTTYHLADALEKQFVFSLDPALDEFALFNTYLSSMLKQHVNTPGYQVVEYGMTEMINNCKDHSRGKKITLGIKIHPDTIYLSCADDGVGLFKHLAAFLHFGDFREVMLELSKGKLTSDPNHHTGEGIFFTSRAFDRFCITANGFCYLRDNLESDWSFLRSDNKNQGTLVEMHLNRQTNRNLLDVFKAFQDPDTMAFNKTEVLVDLAKEYGSRLISRSQAQRLTRHLNAFTQVTLNFKHVEAVGQGFVDQVFRVYVKQNPQIKVNYINANPDVEFMIQRGII